MDQLLTAAFILHYSFQIFQNDPKPQVLIFLSRHTLLYVFNKMDLKYKLVWHTRKARVEEEQRKSLNPKNRQWDSLKNYYHRMLSENCWHLAVCIAKIWMKNNFISSGLIAKSNKTHYNGIKLKGLNLNNGVK